MHEFEGAVALRYFGPRSSDDRMWLGQPHSNPRAHGVTHSEAPVLGYAHSNRTSDHRRAGPANADGDSPDANPNCGPIDPSPHRSSRHDAGIRLPGEPGPHESYRFLRRSR